MLNLVSFVNKCFFFDNGNTEFHQKPKNNPKILSRVSEPSYFFLGNVPRQLNSDSGLVKGTF